MNVLRLAFRGMSKGDEVLGTIAAFGLDAVDLERRGIIKPHTKRVETSQILRRNADGSDVFATVEVETYVYNGIY